LTEAGAVLGGVKRFDRKVGEDSKGSEK